MEIASRGDLLNKRLEESETNTILEKSDVLRNDVFEEWQIKTGDMIVQLEALTCDTEMFSLNVTCYKISKYVSGRVLATYFVFCQGFRSLLIIRLGALEEREWLLVGQPCFYGHPRTFDAMDFERERERTRSCVDRKVGVDL